MYAFLFHINSHSQTFHLSNTFHTHAIVHCHVDGDMTQRLMDVCLFISTHITPCSVSVLHLMYYMYYNKLLNRGQVHKEGGSIVWVTRQ